MTTAAARKRGHPARTISCPALDYSYNDVSMFLTVLKAGTAFRASFVSRAEEDPQRGFQRALDNRRVERIADYIRDGKVIPGSIILSARPKARLSFASTTKTLSFRETPGAFLVLDGQHRLFGAMKAGKTTPVAVCIVNALDALHIVQYFMDINGTQRGVPRTLQLEIMKFFVDTESDEDMRIRLFSELNTRPDSPLMGRLSPTKSIVGKLSHVPFRSAILPLLAEHPLDGESFEHRVKLILNYLRAADTVLAESDQQAKLVNAAFFQALFGVFSAAMALSETRFGDYKEASLVEVLAPLKEINWEANTGTNKKNIQNLTRHILGLIRPTRARIADDQL
jgi:DNA sulfur modification protein DndB